MNLESDNDMQALLAEIRQTNLLLAKLVHSRQNWRLALRQGLMSGIGGLLGATILGSMLLWILKPLQNLAGIKPTLEQISRQLERNSRD